MADRPDTAGIRSWWETCARSVNAPTPHWSIPVLCDEVDRLAAVEEWARDADHHPGCNGGLGGRCKCGRTALFGDDRG